MRAFRYAGSVETSVYRFEWVGGYPEGEPSTAKSKYNAARNVASVTCDGQPLFSNMQYDSHPNPMRFPMGMETMGVTNMIFEGVLGNSVLFLGYAFC